MKYFAAVFLILFSDAWAQNEEEPGRKAAQVLVVSDVFEAQDRVREALARHGGYVLDVLVEDGGATAALLIRVGSEALDRFLAATRVIGTVESEEVKTQDPTPVFAALNSRLSVLEVTERDLREQLSFLSPDEPLAFEIQKEVEKMRTERAALIAKRMLLEDALIYATVRITLIRDDDLWRDIRRSFSIAINDPTKALRLALPIFGGVLLPYAIVLGIVIIGGSIALRRLRIKAKVRKT